MPTATLKQVLERVPFESKDSSLSMTVDNKLGFCSESSKRAIIPKFDKSKCSTKTTKKPCENGESSEVANLQKDIAKLQVRDSSPPPSPPCPSLPSSISLPSNLDHKDVSLVWRNESNTGGPSAIFVGSEKFSRFRQGLEKFNISAIINCTLDAPNKFISDARYKYFQVSLSDDTSQNILSYLPSVTHFVQHLSTGMNVLIHCSKGMSRSVAIFISWLMEHQKVALKDALKYVKSKRSVAEPNMGFIRQLMLYESFHLEKTSLAEEDLLPCPVCLKVQFDATSFQCGHRVCESCRMNFPEDARCAHCDYQKEASDACGMKDLSQWRCSTSPASVKSDVESD